MVKEYIIRKRTEEHAFICSIYRNSVSHDDSPDGAMKFDDELTAKCVAKHCEKLNKTSYIVLVRTTTFTELPEDTIEPEE